MVAKKKSESETIDRDEFSTRFNWERFRGQLDSVWECCCNFATGWGGEGISQNFFDPSQKKKKKKKKLGILKLTYKFWRCYSFFGTNYTTTFATFVIGTGYTTTFRTAGDWSKHQYITSTQIRAFFFLFFYSIFLKKKIKKKQFLARFRVVYKFQIQFVVVVVCCGFGFGLFVVTLKQGIALLYKVGVLFLLSLSFSLHLFCFLFFFFLRGFHYTN